MYICNYAIICRPGLHSTLDKYVTCLYWCTATMTSTGYGDEHAYLKLEMGKYNDRLTSTEQQFSKTIIH